MNNSSECAGVAACHGAELVFEWDNAAAYNISFTPDETSLAQAFAVVLRQLAAQGSIPWPRFDPESRAFMQIQVSHSLPQPLTTDVLTPCTCADACPLHERRRSGVRCVGCSGRETRRPRLAARVIPLGPCLMLQCGRDSHRSPCISLTSTSQRGLRSPLLSVKSGSVPFALQSTECGAAVRFFINCHSFSPCDIQQFHAHK